MLRFDKIEIGKMKMTYVTQRADPYDSLHKWTCNV